MPEEYRGGTTFTTAEASGAGGTVLRNVHRELLGRTGTTHSAASAPTVNDDSANTAGNGTFYALSTWIDTSTSPATLYLCTDDSEGAANWEAVGSAGTVSLTATAGANLLELDGTTIDLDAQAANRIFAGPASGANAAPSFRSLVADDMPDLSATYEPQFGAGTIATQDADSVAITGGTVYGATIEQRGPFVPYQSNPILEPEGDEGCTCFGSVIKVGSTYHLYYSYTISTRFYVGHATSSDGKTFTKDTGNNPVLSPEDSGVGVLGYDVPFVWYEDGTYHMLCRVHGNLDSGESDATSYATASAPEGPFTEQNSQTPVLRRSVGEWDEYGAEAWGTIKVGDTYHTFYEAAVGGESTARAIGRAYSTDLTNWTKDTINNPIFEDGRYCSDVFKMGQYYYMIVPHYTSGADYAEFELYRDDAITFLPAEREFLGVIKETSYSGWDSRDIDTPCVLTDDIGRDTFAASSDQLWMYHAGISDVWQTGLRISNITSWW